LALLLRAKCQKVLLKNKRGKKRFLFFAAQKCQNSALFFSFKMKQKIYIKEKFFFCENIFFFAEAQDPN